MRPTHRGRTLRRTLRRTLPPLRATGRAVITLCFLGAANPTDLKAQLAVDQMEVFLEPHRPDARASVIRVTNNSERAAQATLQLADWDRDENGSNQFHEAGTRRGSCAQTLKVTPSTLRLEPGTSQDVVVALADDATPRDECWSILFVETALPPAVLRERSVSFVIRTGVKIYVVPPGTSPGGEITDMKVRRREASDSGGVAQGHDAALELTFRNVGNRHAVAHGTIEFRRADNSIAAKVDCPQLYALPGAIHRVAIGVPKLAAGRYVVLAVIDYGGDELVAAQLDYEVP